MTDTLRDQITNILDEYSIHAAVSLDHISELIVDKLAKGGIVARLDFWVSDTGDLCADTIVGRYQIQKGGARYCMMPAMGIRYRPHGHVIAPTFHRTIEAAIAAAQAHYNEHILSAMDQTMTDGNTDAINSHPADREAYYDRTQSMVDDIEALRDEVDVLIAKLAEVEGERDDLAGGQILNRAAIRTLKARAEAAKTAPTAAYRAGIEDALGRIDDFNTLPPDKSGHRWRESDLLDQEVISIRALPTPTPADLAERLKETK